jgi:hypothetical protein
MFENIIQTNLSDLLSTVEDKYLWFVTDINRKFPRKLPLQEDLFKSQIISDVSSRSMCCRFDSKSITVKFPSKISPEVDEYSFPRGQAHGPVNSDAMYAEGTGREKFCVLTSTWSHFLSLSFFIRNQKPLTAE